MRPLFLWRNKIQDCNYNTTILHFGYYLDIYVDFFSKKDKILVNGLYFIVFFSQNSLITIVYY